MKNVHRCSWAERTAPEYCIPYHDKEWGVPLHDDRRLFEFLVLDGFQAGLSWATILKKRRRFQQVFDDFDPRKVAAYGPKKIRRLLADPGIIRNRLKVEAAVDNAKAFLEIQDEFGSFDSYIWRFVGGRPRVNSWKRWEDIPSTSAESDAMSRDLKQRGFSFAGSTICYAFMQAAGLVNDHETDCFRYEEIIQMSDHRRYL